MLIILLLYILLANNKGSEVLKNLDCFSSDILSALKWLPSFEVWGRLTDALV